MNKLLLVLLLFISSIPVYGSISRRVEQISGRFIGTHYVLDPFGEGQTGKYDRDPVYRFDAFDCTTYVETVLALALSRQNDFQDFLHTIQGIRYKNGEVSYTMRNHFPETDWIPNNTRAGYVHDLTRQIAGPFKVDVAEALIDKLSWYEHKKADQINVPGISKEQRTSLLNELHAEGRVYGTELSVMPYISIETFFPHGRANRKLFRRIPSGIVMNVIRPNWDLTSTEGTHLNVSHQALVIRKNGKLYVRHATTGTFMRVVEQPFRNYLRALIGHPTIKGVNFLGVGG